MLSLSKHARLPPSLLRSFGGLILSPDEALAQAGRRAKRANDFSAVSAHPLRTLCGLCVKPSCCHVTHD